MFQRFGSIANLMEKTQKENEELKTENDKLFTVLQQMKICPFNNKPNLVLCRDCRKFLKVYKQCWKESEAIQSKNSPLHKK